MDPANRELIERYLRCYNDKDVDGMVGLFTEDAVFESVSEYDGRDSDRRQGGAGPACEDERRMVRAEAADADRLGDRRGACCCGDRLLVPIGEGPAGRQEGRPGTQTPRRLLLHALRRPHQQAGRLHVMRVAEAGCEFCRDSTILQGGSERKYLWEKQLAISPGRWPACNPGRSDSVKIRYVLTGGKV